MSYHVFLLASIDADHHAILDLYGERELMTTGFRRCLSTSGHPKQRAKHVRIRSNDYAIHRNTHSWKSKVRSLNSIETCRRIAIEEKVTLTSFAVESIEEEDGMFTRIPTIRMNDRYGNTEARERNPIISLA